MDPARIAELLQPFLREANDQRPHLACPELSEGANDALTKDISTYIDLLLRWNTRVNLTAIRNQEEIVTRHFGESLFAARHLFPPPANQRQSEKAHSAVKDLDSAETRSPKPETRLADLGSGAGFPGIPIKLWAPDIALTLLESNHKKAAFLREVVRSLTLMNVNIQNTRAENLTQTFDVITLRAVERFPNALLTAARLLAPSARLALLISRPQLGQAHATLPHLTWHPPIPIPDSQSRLLLIGVVEPKQ